MADNETPAAAAQPLRLPAFTPLNPQPWFLRSETLFRNRRLSATQQADVVLEHLPDDVWNTITPWFLTLTEPATYDIIKQKLMTLYSPTPSTRARQFFAYVDADLGDTKPSHFLYEVKRLLALPASSSHPAGQVDLPRELLLTRLPASIRTAIPNASTMDLDDLLQKADSMMEAHNARKSTTAAQVHHSSDSEDSESGFAAPVSTNHYRHFRKPFQHPKQQPPDDRWICYFHRKFKAAARKCEPGCKFSKNGQKGCPQQQP